MHVRFIKRLTFFILLAATAMASDGGFLFVTFKNGSNPLAEQIYFATSQDGRTWSALNGSWPVLVSQLGETGARDPYIVRSHDGSKFYILATDLSIYYNGNWTRAVQAGSHSINVWESEDLVHWSQPRLVAVAPDDAGCTWAPEAVYDETTGDYLVFWASTSASDSYAKQRIWACRTTDFRTFSTPIIYIERSTAVIDADIVNDGGTYYRFTKDESASSLVMETSSQLMGPWTTVSGFSLAAIQGYEGPECYQLSPGNWCLIADHFWAGTGYEPFTTTDLASGSFASSAGFSFPFAFRHGAVLRLTTDEYTRLTTGLSSSPRIHAHLPFNEASGTDAADAAAHEWNATLANGALLTAGHGGNALSLDGVDDYASLPKGITYALGDFTISTWVKINTLTTWSRVFDFGTGTSRYMFLTPKAGSGNVRFAISTSGYNNEQQISGTAPLPTGEWTHVAVTVSGSLGILYVNGVEVGRNASMSRYPGLLGATTQNWLGRSQFASDPYLDAQIDDFRIYSAALSASEVQTLASGLAGALPTSWSDQDLGSPALAGSASESDDAIVITGTGAGVQGSADEGHFAYQTQTGDVVFTACLDTLSVDAAASASAGIVLRESLDASARCVFLGRDQSGNLTWTHRDTAGDATTSITISGAPPTVWLRIARVGDIFTAYSSTDGTTWTQVGSPVTLTLPATSYMGLAVGTGDSTTLEAARFTAVAASTPPTPPASVSAVAQGNAIALSWDSVAGVESYNLKRATSSSGPYSTLAAQLTSTDYTDTTAAADGTTYYYVVSTLSSGIEGADSTPSSATLYTDYQQWKIASGLDVTIADSATPGADGMPILVKYALGYAPDAVATSPITLQPAPSLGISFTRLSPAVAQIEVQTSPDLVTWTDIATLAYGSDTWTGSAEVAEDTSTTPRKVTVHDTTTSDAAPHTFYRLQVTRSAP